MSIEAMKQALEALDKYGFAPCDKDEDWQGFKRAIESLRAAIEQAECPVEYTGNGTFGREADVKPTGFFFQMPQREWQTLTDEEMMMIYGQSHEAKKYSLGRAIEQALREKNT